jgi:hypothetical protein
VDPEVAPGLGEKLASLLDHLLHVLDCHDRFDSVVTLEPLVERIE